MWSWDTSESTASRCGSLFTPTTTMASPLPVKESKVWQKSLRRGLNRVRDVILPNSHPHSPALPESSTANDDRSHSILSTPHPSSGTDSAYKVSQTPGVEANRSQDTIFPTSRTSSQQFSHPETSHKIEKAWGVTRSALMTALRLLEKSAGACPPLKSAVGGLVACLDLTQVRHGCGFNPLYV